MNRLLLLAGGVLIVAAGVLATITAGASPGDVVAVRTGTPVVLSGAQATAAGNWAKTVWPSIVVANVDHIDGFQEFDPAQGGYTGRWRVEACDERTLTDAEYAAARLAGQVQPGQSLVIKCLTAGPPPLPGDTRIPDAVLTQAQIDAMLTAIGAWASPAPPSPGAVDSWIVARTPGQLSRVTATANPVQTLSPAAFRTADNQRQIARVIALVQ
jgi:hypothetical protein